MILERLAEIVRKYGEKSAVVSEGHSVSYRELNSMANGVAGALKAGDNRRVGLLFSHGIPMIGSLLGAVKSGKTFVALDVTYPLRRLCYMIDDAGIETVVTERRHSAVARRILSFTKKSIELLFFEDLMDYSGDDLFSREPDLCYILYTSGSTGKPKGIMQNTENMIYYVDNWIERTDMGPSDRVTFLSSFAHDGAMQDIFSALLSGAALYPYGLKEEGAIEMLPEFMKEEGITIYHSVPTVFRYMCRYMTEDLKIDTLRVILLGGEALRRDDLLLARENFPNSDFFNVYGQSESSVTAMWKLDPQESFSKVKLGDPLSSTEILLLDENGEETGTMETGEIFVVCPHIALGYLNDEKRSSEVFLTHSEIGRVYRTGDLARMDFDGSVEFMGRKDDQLKIRGLRIETGEIESVMLGFPKITNAVVLPYGEDEKELISFYTVDGKVDAEILRAHLMEYLPAYMVPVRFLERAFLPKTPSGKIDKRALLDQYKIHETHSEFHDPREGTERAVASIWRGVLSMNRIGALDNFFAIGGHSLNATIILSRIHREFGVKVSLPTFFKNPTVRSLAEIVEKSEKRWDYIEIPRLNHQDSYELSYNQKRLWYLAQMNPHSRAYGISRRYVLDHPVHEESLIEAWREMAARHESLRTSFREINGEPRQLIHKNVKVPFHTVDLSALDPLEKKKRCMSVYDEVTGSGFNLSESSLFRTVLVKLDERKYELFCRMHHIITDGWSMGIFQKEFFHIYNRLKSGTDHDLKPVALQYKDYAAWHNRLVRDPEVHAGSHAYWQNRMNEGFPVMELPRDFRGNDNDRRASAYINSVDAKTRDGLLKIARRMDTTLFSVLFTAYNVLLSKLTGSRDVVVSVINAGRNHHELTNVFGYFVNSIPIRSVVDQELGFDELLEAINTKTMEAMEHQHYPLELVLDETGDPYPEVSASFNMLNMKETIHQDLDTFEKRFVEEMDESGFQLEPYISEYRNGMEVFWIYRRASFKPETVKKIGDGFLKLLRMIVMEEEGQ